EMKNQISTVSAYGKPPFEKFDGYQILLRINRGHHETTIDGTPPEYVKLYTECWDEDPEKRPTIDVILEKLYDITWKTEIKQVSEITTTPVVDNSTPSIGDIELTQSSPLSPVIAEMKLTVKKIIQLECIGEKMN